MQCPYCYGAVHEEASRCLHCRREIAVFHPLLRRLDALQARVGALEAWQAQAGRTSTPTDEGGGATTLHRAIAAQPESSAPVAGESTPVLHPLPHASGRHLASWALGTVALLGSLHLLLLFALDANPLLLRLATLVVPLAAGALALRQRAARGLTRLSLALFVGLGAVGLMLAMTAVLDGVSFWPVDAREWRETVEYTLGITLAFLGGGLVHRSWRRASLWRRRRQSSQQPVPLTGWRAAAARGLERVRQVASFVAPVATCITAFYSGLRSFLGL